MASAFSISKIPYFELDYEIFIFLVKLGKTKAYILPMYSLIKFVLKKFQHCSRRTRQVYYMDILYNFTVNTLMAGFLNRDEEILQYINSLYSENLRNDNWYFTLPQLFCITLKLYLTKKKYINAEWNGSYIEFRKSLYQNPTNTILNRLGGLVEVSISKTNHTETIYVLRRIEASA